MKKETGAKLSGERGIALMESLITLTVSLTLIGGQIALLIGEAGIINKAKSKQDTISIKDTMNELATELRTKCIECKYIYMTEDLTDYLEADGVKIISDNEDGTLSVEYEGYDFMINKDTLNVTIIEN